MSYEVEKAACAIEGVIAVLDDMRETCSDLRMSACIVALSQVLRVLGECQDNGLSSKPI